MKFEQSNQRYSSPSGPGSRNNIQDHASSQKALLPKLSHQPTQQERDVAKLKERLKSKKFSQVTNTKNARNRAGGNIDQNKTMDANIK